MELEHALDYIFPIFVGTMSEDGESFVLDKDGYCGTGFFVARNGIALTAAHVLPEPDSIKGKIVCAGIRNNEKGFTGRRILSYVVYPGLDIAVVQVEITKTNYLPVSYEQLYMGMDVVAFGIPLSSVVGNRYGMRCFKGSVTWVSRFAEVSFSAPRGLSGSPVLQSGKVVGVVSGNTRSEQLEDQVETIEEITNGKEKITIVQSKSVVEYGLVEQLFPLKNAVHEIFGAASFSSLLEKINNA